MYVGRAVTHGLRQDATDDLYDRCIVGHDIRRQSRGVEASPPGALHCLEGLDEMVESADGSVVVLDGTADLGEWRQHGPDGGPTRLAEKREELLGRLIGHRNVEADLVEGHGDDEVLTSHGIGDEIQRLLFGTGLSEVGHVHPVKLCTCRNELVLVEHPHADEHVAEVGAGRGF